MLSHLGSIGQGPSPLTSWVAKEARPQCLSTPGAADPQAEAVLPVAKGREKVKAAAERAVAKARAEEKEKERVVVATTILGGSTECA